MSEIKAVEQAMPEPFGHIRIDVRPWSWANRPGVQGHTVGIMNMNQGQGSRGSLEYAEAEAKAVLKAIRTYRRKNATHLSTDPSSAPFFPAITDPEDPTNTDHTDGSTT